MYINTKPYKSIAIGSVRFSSIFLARFGQFRTNLMSENNPAQKPWVSRKQQRAALELVAQLLQEQSLRVAQIPNCQIPDWDLVPVLVSGLFLVLVLVLVLVPI